MSNKKKEFIVSKKLPLDDKFKLREIYLNLLDAYQVFLNDNIYPESNVQGTNKLHILVDDGNVNDDSLDYLLENSKQDNEILNLIQKSIIMLFKNIDHEDDRQDILDGIIYESGGE